MPEDDIVTRHSRWVSRSPGQFYTFLKNAVQHSSCDYFGIELHGAGVGILELDPLIAFNCEQY